MTKFFDTDGEAGDENLSHNADTDQALRALKVMYQRGLIDEKTYHLRLKAIQNER